MVRLFGKNENGQEVYCYTLVNGKMRAEILTLGGIIRVLEFGGVDVVGGFDTLEGYLADTTYQGAIIGRVGNRIKNASFTLNGAEYKLYKNNGNNHLHGGKEGFNKKNWSVLVHDAKSITLAYSSPDGEEGYPGKLDVKVKYTLYPDALRIDYEAKSDKDTYCNLTNHAYFNLDGVGESEIINHSLSINHISYTAVDSELIPTGEHPSLDFSPYDFRKEKKIGKELIGKNRDEQLYGYDHNFILDAEQKVEFDGTLYNDAAILKSGKLSMSVYTTKPCIQLYTGAFIEDDKNNFKGNKVKFPRMALALETQFEPDAPTRCENVLLAGVLYKHSTVYRFN